MQTLIPVSEVAKKTTAKQTNRWEHRKINCHGKTLTTFQKHKVISMKIKGYKKLFAVQNQHAKVNMKCKILKK